MLERAIVPCGLGARDTLRLEACYPLHGNDISPETDAISAGLGWVCALDKEFTGRRGAAADQGARGRSGGSSPFVLEERAFPDRGWRSSKAGEVTSGTHSPTLDVGHRHGLRPRRAGRARHRDYDRRARAERRARVVREADLPTRGDLSRGGRRELSRRPEVPPRARLGPHRGRRGGARDHLARPGRARRARPLRAARGGRDDREGRGVRRGRVGQGRLGPDRTALRRGARGQRDGRRRARDWSTRTRTARAGSYGSGSATRPRSKRSWTPRPTARCVAEQ